MADCLHIPTGREALVLLALSGAGIFGNYLNITLFFGVEFIFGSIATMIALRISGIVWGTIVGVVIASYTILLWGHSYAVIIFGLEALVVGFVLCCLKKDNAVLIDAGYWLVIGMPLVWVFYTYQLGLPETAVQLIMLKQAVNGIFNVVVATLVLQFSPLHTWTKGLENESRTWPFQQLLNTMLAGAILAPILLITAVSTRGELREVQTALDQQVMVRLDHAVDKLSDQTAHLANLVTIVSRDALYEPEHTRKEAYSILKFFPELIGLGLFKADGDIIASYGLGMDMIDQYTELFPLTTTKVSLVRLPGTRKASGTNLLAIIVPYGEENLYAIGWLEPKFFDIQLSEFANAESYKLDLRDAQGQLIASNNPELNFRNFVSGANPNHLLPANTNLPDMVRWRKSFWVHQEPVEIGDGWTLTYGGSMASTIDILQEDYVEKLFLAFVVEILVLLLVPLAVRAIYRPIEQLTVAANLLKESTTREDIIWPDESITEIGSLVTGFKGLIRQVNSNAQKLNQAVQLAKLGHWVWDQNEDRMIDCSEEFARIEGRTVEECLQCFNSIEADHQSIHPEDRAEYLASIKAYDKKIKRGENAGIRKTTYRIVTPAGEVRHVRETAETMLDDSGHATLIFGSVQDITEEMAARSEREQLLGAVENLEECIALFDRDDRIVFCNQAYRDLNQTIIEFTEPGTRFEDHLRAGVRAGVMPDGVGREDEWVEERLHNHINPTGPIEVCRQNGMTILINEQRMPDGGIMLVISDITELKKSQQQVIQASKLATLGEMATGVAHELNQPLNVIRMATGNTLLRLENGEMDRDYIEKKLIRIEEQTERAAAIIDHMRMFGRKAEEPAHPVDPREVLNSAMGLIGEQFRLDGIEIATEFPADCAMVMGHAIQLEQVTLNLLANAKDAIDENAGDRKITMTVTQEDDRICMKIEDSGGGIPEDVLPRVFEPFYTTKEMGKGTGLGLSVSYGIIRDMGGTIEAVNGAEGACFTITLPAVAESQAMADEDTGPAPAIAMEG